MTTEPSPNNEQRLPLRGMAMILIAVALLLAAWGVYSMTREKASDTTVTAESTTTQMSRPQQPTTVAKPPETTAAPVPPPPTHAEVKKVHVLNNSTIQGLAAGVADKLKHEGWELGEVGNFPDGAVPQNTVYFTPENAAAEKAARTLAERVGGVAVPRADNLPGGTEDPNTVVLVLAEEVN
ncbi:LytR cell envelope-related transcriptional attenuator protein [Corynebacterium ulcerans]|uniref:LytR C-terminal domain-containing protein n=1 Tax=Corynebacterium ulcerans TaxID=65058 RepID=UPI000521121F|nr:LytR C-terminal domain-containing protein [Corynebacterium ulcerans]AIU31285.1 LytR cell envelope-related transcriptional attenuator protein [Corynebacterium ulcerans]AIU92551.1 LytR cell envelope-related transcriptional attenuator protein [Corynebacterium ulcerans]NOL62722.1 LytR C-terminal domain-containing protein [Corynebacterium ulcerans]NON17147.1 LytR C-terminal domain-containing protein [Corynebacterium ulcerans]